MSGHARRFGGVERAVERGQAEDRGRANLQGGRAVGGVEGAAHVEHAVFVRAPPPGQTRGAARVARVEVQPARRAGTGVEIFVMAPEGEIRAVRTQGVRHHADRVRQIEPDGDACPVRTVGQSREVEQLAGGVNHAGQHGELDVGRIGESAQDGVVVEQAIRAGRHEDQMMRRVESSPAQMAGDRVEIGRKFVGERQDFRACSAGVGLVECPEKLVQVDRGGVGNGHFFGPCADERSHARGKTLRQREPRRRGVQPSADGKGFPSVERALHAGFGGQGEQAE